MGRLTATNRSALDLQHVRLVHLVSLAFPGVTFRFCDWSGIELTYDSQVYVGDSTLLSFDSVSERTDGKVASMVIQLSAANAALLAAFNAGGWHYHRAEIIVGLLSSSYQFVDTPESLGPWYMSTGELDYEQGVLGIVTEPVANDLRRKKLLTSSDADQQLRYPGDTLFRFTPQMEERVFAWGVPATASSGIGGVGGFGGVIMPGQPFGLFSLNQFRSNNPVPLPGDPI
jgi:hypothetical protein